MNYFGLTGENATTVNLDPCTGVFRESLGCPCAHEVQRRLRQGEVLFPEDFHQHWHVIDTIEPVDYRYLVQDPERIVRRRASQPNTAPTGRIRSRFEQIDAQLDTDVRPENPSQNEPQHNINQHQQPDSRKRKRGVTCGACGASGHKRTNRECPQYRQRQAGINESHNTQDPAPLQGEQAGAEVSEPSEDPLPQLEAEFARATSPLMLRSIATDIASQEEDREWSKLEEEKTNIERQFEFPLERLRIDYDEWQLFIRVEAGRGEVPGYILERRDQAREALNAMIREKEDLLAGANDKWQQALAHNAHQQNLRKERWLRLESGTN